MRGWGPILAGVTIGCVLALAVAFGLMPGGSMPPAVHAAPVLKVTQDRWRVDAALPGIDRFTFVIWDGGSSEVYMDGVPSPFTIDPFTFGGRSVSLSARAAGRTTNPWSRPVKVDVPPPKPVLAIASDHWHVDAYLPGTKTFTFVVKTPGSPDAYTSDVTPPFAIDREKFGGRSVSVSARATGPPTRPWAPEVNVDVPQEKLFGMVDATGSKGTSGADAKKLGIELDRIEFTFGEDLAAMDAAIARDTSQGLMPLVLLNQTSTTIPGSVRPISQFDLDGWKTWASGVVARYGPDGSFWRGRKDGRYAPTHFEVLNEPYGWWFFTPPEPAAYARFFVAVVAAAKQANPRAKFLLAGSPYTFIVSGKTYSSQTWDSLLMNSPDGAAAQQLADGVTVHPYGSFTADPGWRGAVTTHNDFPDLPVWITEIGYRLGDVVDGTAVTADAQAALMRRTLVDYMSWPWAQAYVWFKWFDYDDRRTGEHNWYGVVEPDGSHRPAYDTYRSFIAAYTGHP